MGEPTATSPKLSRPSVALLLLLLINLMNYVDRQILAAVEKPIGDEFGVGTNAMGWLVPAFLVSYMLFSPLFGVLADRISRWWIVGGGVLVWSLASGGTGAVHLFGLLVTMRIIIGVGEAAYGPVAPTIISDIYPIDRRGKVLAWFYAAIPVGSALGYVIGGLLHNHWHLAFFLTLPPGVLLAAWCFFMPEPQRTINQRQRATLDDYLSLLRNKSYVLDSLGMTAMTFALGGMGYWMPRYLQEAAGLNPSSATPIFGGIAAGAGLVATIVGGIVGDRVRTRHPGSYFIVSGIGLLVAAPLTILMLITPFPACWLVIAATIFCLFFNTGPTNAIIANVTTTRVRATAFAMNILLIHALGDALSPPVIGYIASSHGWRIAFGAMSVMMVIGGICWLLGAPHLRRDTETAASADGQRQGFEVLPIG